MMDYSHVSPEVYLRKEDDTTIEFKKNRHDDEKKPSPEECKGKLTGVCLTYACCGEQDFGIKSMATAFDATGSKGRIKKVPLEVVESEGVRAIKYGRNAQLDEIMMRGAKEAGIIGYWDDANLIICAAPEYGFVIDSIKEMFKPNNVRFGFSRSFAGRNLLILAI